MASTLSVNTWLIRPRADGVQAQAARGRTTGDGFFHLGDGADSARQSGIMKTQIFNFGGFSESPVKVKGWYPVELATLLIANQSNPELTGSFIAAVNASGNALRDRADALGTLDVRVRLLSAHGWSQLVPLLGNARSECSRSRAEFGPDH